MPPCINKVLVSDASVSVWSRETPHNLERCFESSSFTNQRGDAYFRFQDAGSRALEFLDLRAYAISSVIRRSMAIHQSGQSCDVMKNITKEGYEMIGNGNEAAHHGDVIADSAFYLSFQRYDEDTFVHIYGLSANQSKLFGKSYPLFLVITLHYTL
jgi:hypothetical protein